MSLMKGDPAQAAIRASTFPIDGGIIQSSTCSVSPLRRSAR